MPLPLPDQAPRPQTRTVARFLFGVAGAALLIAFLAGCSHWPSGETELSGPELQARQERCKLAKKQCQQRQETREQDCAADYRLVKSDYDQCVKDKTCKCRAPIACLGADLGICDQQFESCMAECGRRISQEPTAETDPANPEVTTTPEIDQVPPSLKAEVGATVPNFDQSHSAPKADQAPSTPKTKDATAPKPGLTPTAPGTSTGKNPAN